MTTIYSKRAADLGSALVHDGQVKLDDGTRRTVHMRWLEARSGIREWDMGAEDEIISIHAAFDILHRPIPIDTMLTTEKGTIRYTADQEWVLLPDYLPPYYLVRSAHSVEREASLLRVPGRGTYRVVQRGRRLIYELKHEFIPLSFDDIIGINDLGPNDLTDDANGQPM